ncbi:MAG: WbqC family protein [Flavobacteriales bacterium Tduv]
MRKSIIIPLYYFAPISYYAYWLQANDICLEKEDYYEKQTYRSRCYIYAAKGRLMLNIPIEHKGGRKYKDIRISYESPWRKQHLKSLKTAYQSSPYYEFYEDDFLSLFEYKETFLWDFNWRSTQVICNLLEIDPLSTHTETYEKKHAEAIDLRNRFNVKNPSSCFPKYYQVFSEKHGFISDLSILDLLFHQGKYSIQYLKNSFLTIQA